MAQVSHLVTKVDYAVQKKDEELGDLLTEIFVELGQGYVEQIINEQNWTVPGVLLKLITIPEICK